MNTRVGRIAWRQARLGGFIESSFPSPEASEDDDDDDEDENEDASSPSNDEMIAWFTYPLSFMIKKNGVVLVWE